MLNKGGLQLSLRRNAELGRAGEELSLICWFFDSRQQSCHNIFDSASKVRARPQRASVAKRSGKKQGNILPCMLF
jgi:hypothetical protein